MQISLTAAAFVAYHVEMSSTIAAELFVLLNAHAKCWSIVFSVKEMLLDDHLCYRNLKIDST